MTDNAKRIKDEIAAARQNVNREPTEGQKHAGNYKMGHLTINGYDISLENPKGSYRRGTDPDGKKWSCRMYHDYGYFRSTKGKDGDAIDVFIGDDYDSKKIFVIDQIIKGKFDESKVMFCFKSEKDAMEGYLANYEKGWSAGKHITEVLDDIFREWLYDGYKQRKPFYEYVQIKQNKLNEMMDIARAVIRENRQSEDLSGVHPPRQVRLDRDGINRLVAECAVRLIEDAGLDRNLNEGWRQAALGAAMGLATLGSMQSCSNNPVLMNKPVGYEYSNGSRQGDQNSQGKWAYYYFIGGKFEASVCRIKDKAEISDLQIDAQKYSNYNIANFGWAAWNYYSGNPPRYVETRMSEDRQYLVDLYHVTQSVNNGMDATCNIEVCYLKDERIPKNESIQFIRVYHTPEDFNETVFTITIDKIKGTSNLNITK